MARKMTKKEQEISRKTNAAINAQLKKGIEKGTIKDRGSLGIEKQLNAKPGQSTRERNIAIAEKSNRTGKLVKDIQKDEVSKQKKPKQPIGDTFLDTISAPLSHPLETAKGFLTGDLARGPEAVRESREQIEAGNFGEAAKVIGKTIGTTAVLAAATLAVGSAIGSVTAKLATHAPTAGTTITTKAGGTQLLSKIANTAVRNGNWARVANNAKNFALKKSYLQKLASAATNPYAVLGIFGTTLYTSLFWAPNEKGDALVTLNIAQGRALQNGDTDMVIEIDDLIQETLGISASIPVVGFIQAEIAKFKAAATASEAYRKQAEKAREENERLKEQGESDFAKERRESDEASFERKREFGEEETERYDKIREENEEREEKKDEEDRREREIMQRVWELRREGKFTEADELELTI